MEQALLDLMVGAGVHVERYHPLHWYHLARINNRNHRKLLIVDGEVGFTGGVGIADNWDGDATAPDHWRDSHYRLQGPAVAQMQAAFLDNWIKATGTLLQGEEYFPTLTAVGDARAQVFTSSPSGGGDSMLLMYLLSITAAERTIDLSVSYFVPDDLTRAALRAALERGVRVRIIAPGGASCSTRVRRSTSSSPPCFTARCWSSTGSWCRWARRTSTIARSGSTTRRTSTSTMPSSRRRPCRASGRAGSDCRTPRVRPTIP